MEALISNDLRILREAAKATLTQRHACVSRLQLRNGSTFSVFESPLMPGIAASMASTSDTLKWSAQLRPAPSSKKLLGDKIILPPTALEALLAAAPVVTVEQATTSRSVTSNFDPFNPYTYAAERQAREAIADRQQQLPHPLTFRIVNPSNGRAVYAGIREFSAEENEIHLSSFLRNALGLSDIPSTNGTREATPNSDVVMGDGEDLKNETLTIHARQLPKGTHVRLRPLEAGYDPEDWKSLLERYLRDNFTTLTLGEVLDVSASRHEHFKFLVDKFEPEADGICIVDTDLEVDIEALNEDQARETLAKQLAKRQKAPGTQAGSSLGGNIETPFQSDGQVLPGEYVDYELNRWDRSQDLEVSLLAENEVVSIDLLVSPMSSHQRGKPRMDEHVFADLSGRQSKRIKLSHRNVDIEQADSLAISVHAWLPASSRTGKLPESAPLTFKLQVTADGATEGGQADVQLAPDEVVCKNCHQHIPKRTLPLHEAFCYRNNVLCPKCSNVFLKSSEGWKTHWHCPHDEDFGQGELSRQKHDSIFHPSSAIQCPNCDFEAFDLPILASHRTSTCPGKEILCQFCHLIVPQQGPEDLSFSDPEMLLSGLTPHEFADGARTTECHLCKKIVRLRDMRTHLGLHDRDRILKVKPATCVNVMCRRTIRAGEERRVEQEQLGLCNEDFAPLYNTSYDPEGKALRRRIERRLLQQLIGGCGKSWCHNKDWCKTGFKNVTHEDRSLTAKEGLPLIKPIMEDLLKGDASSLSFCVDQGTQHRQDSARVLGQVGEYDLEWCMKAVEESKGDMNDAQAWLVDHAPKIDEVVRRR